MITIYPDTQHVSRIASGTSPLAGYLQDQRNAIVLAFSQSHVVESLPKDTASIPSATARLSLITNKSGVGLKPWFDIPMIEFRSSLGLELNDIQIDIGDILFPDLAISRSDWIRTARGLLTQELSSIPDPNIRRSMRARIFKLGRFTPEAIQMLKDRQAQTISTISKEAPLMAPLVAGGGMYDFLAGRVSERQFTRLMKETLMSPVALAQFAANPELNSIFDLSKFFWTQMDEMSAKLSNLIGKLIDIQITHLVFDYKRIRPILLNMVQSNDMVVGVVSKVVGRQVSAQQLANMRGTVLFAKTFLQYALDKADAHANVTSKNFGSEIKFKRSDLGDLTHLFYAPYVSVFGCDRYMRSLVARTGFSTERMATTDREMIETIERVRRGIANNQTNAA